MKHPSSFFWSRGLPHLVALAACLLLFSSLMASPSFPLVLEPTERDRREAPERTVLDLRHGDTERIVAEARGLNAGLITSFEASRKMTFRTALESPAVFAFYVPRVAPAGGAVDVIVDGEHFRRLFWFGGAEAGRINTLYYLPLPAGTEEVELRASRVAGRLFVERVYFLNTMDELPEVGRRVEVRPEPLPEIGTKADGYRGIWFTLGQFTEFGDKYSGGLGTYTANHVPLAIYAEEVNKTFFVYGGTLRDDQHLLIMASSYDHEHHRVPRPTIVHDKQGVSDPHDNPSIAIDGEGYIWVFVSGRGRSRPGFKYRSTEPYSVERLERIAEQEITYPQPWWVEGKGFLHLFTKYTQGRELYWETSPDGREWSEDRKLAGMEGHYQVSSQLGGKIGTFFNRHPGGSVDRRTDLYYMQTTDFGETWTTVDGQVLELPLEQPDNPARVIDYAARGRLQYTVDLAWDREGNPILLYVTSGGFAPGPANEPRFWEIAHWDGSEWQNHVVCRSDHNYDLGSLHVFDDRWLIIGPTGTGPQAWGTGGEVEMWESRDQGRRWTKIRQVTVNSERNHMYVRRPVGAKDPFFAFWADGNPDEPSLSKLYFGESTGERYWVLPYDMEGDFAEPVEIRVPLR